MPKVPSDWRAYQRGRIPRDFTACGDPAATWLVTANVEDDRSRQWVAARAGSSPPAALLWNGHDGAADQEWLALVQPRAMATAGYATCLRTLPDLSAGLFAGLLPQVSGVTVTVHVYIYQVVGSVQTTLANAIPVAIIAQDEAYYVRFRAAGSAVSLKIWNEHVTEPVSWTLTATTTLLSGGQPGFALNAAAEAYDVLSWSYASAGATADLPAVVLPRSLGDAVRAGAQIATMIEIAGCANLETGATESLFFSAGGQLINQPGTGDLFPEALSIEPLLRDAGTLAATLNGDSQFGGEGLTSPWPLKIGNTLGQAWRLLRYAIAGRPAVVRMGEIGNPLRTWEVVFAAAVAQEPDVDAAGATISVAAANARAVKSRLARVRGTPGGLNPIQQRLALPALVSIYSGIPSGLHCITATGVATAAYNAAWDLPDFTLVRRWRAGHLTGSGACNLARKGSGALRNFDFALINASSGTRPGQLQFFASSGGNPTAILLDSGFRVDDDQDHVAVVGCFGSAGTSFLMLDGEVIATQEGHGAPDLPATAITWGNLVDGGAASYLGELALIAGYIPPGEAAALTNGGRIATTQNGLVALWSHDDVGGAVVTDYGPAAVNATIAGTITTDFSWIRTDQGDPGFAGKSMPFLHGLVYNVAADQSDAAPTVGGPRYRYNDNREAPVGVPVVRTRGVVMAVSTDYTLTGRGVAASVSATAPVGVSTVLEGAEPETLSGATPDPVGAQLAAVFEDVLTVRSQLDRDVDWSREAVAAFGRVLPLRAGVAAASGQRPTVEEILTRLLEPTGAHLRLDADARLVPGVLLPPVNPGPYGIEGLLEFRGGPGAGVSFGQVNGAALTSDHSIVALIKTPDLPTDLSQWNVMVGSMPAGYAVWDRTGGATGAYLGLSATTRGSLVFGHPGLATAGGAKYVALPANSLQPGVWYLICGSFNGTTKVRSVHAHAVGVSPAGWISASQTTTTAYAVGDDTQDPLVIGGGSRGSFVGGITRPQLWNVALTPADSRLSNQLGRPVDPTTTGLRFAPPLTEGRGTFCTDPVTGAKGRISGARWTPALTLDFRKTDSANLGAVHYLTPLSSVRIGYKINHAPMQEADIAGGVTGTARVELKQVSREVSNQAAPPQSTTWLVPRAFDQDSALVRRSDANAVRRALEQRMSPERLMAQVDGLRRLGLTLQLLDEVVLYADTDPNIPSADMSHGRVFRLTGLTTQLADMVSALILWGGAGVDNTRITDDGSIRITDDGAVRETD